MGCREVKSLSSFPLKVQLRQSDPIQQYDLPLGMAKEAEDTHASQVPQKYAACGLAEAIGYFAQVATVQCPIIDEDAERIAQDFA